MSVVSTAWAELNSTELNDHYIDCGEEDLPVEDLWINSAPQTEVPFVRQLSGGLSPMTQMGEGEPFPADQPAKGSTQSIYPTEWGKKVVLTGTALRRDQHGILRRHAGELGRTARHRKRVQSYSVLNNATDSSYTGFDALSLLNTAHTQVKSGATYANRTSGAVSLGEIGVLDSFARMRLQDNAAGLPHELTASWLHYRPTRAQHQKAQHLFATSGRPFSMDNEFNTITLEGCKLLPSRYITSTTLWILTAEQGQHDLWRLDEVDPLMSSWDDKDTRSMFMACYMSLSVFFGSPRGVDGNPGA